jgi:hypothetical protein
MNRHFIRDNSKRRKIPEKGDLIRSDSSMNFVNIVHEVVREPELDTLQDYAYLIFSTRYAETKKLGAYYREVTYLTGQRARSFIWHVNKLNGWAFNNNWNYVKEVDRVPEIITRYKPVPVDNAAMVAHRLAVGYETYKANEEESSLPTYNEDSQDR